MPAMIIEKVNGFPIIAQVAFSGDFTSRPGRIIVVDRNPNGELRTGRFVVAKQYRTNEMWDNEWAHGDYCESIAFALDTFIEHIQREFSLVPQETV